MFRHPNYYKNLRKLARNRDPHVRPISGSADSATDQAISKQQATASSTRSTGPGLKLQAREDSTAKRVAEPQASSKPQAPSSSKKEPQAASPKQQASSSKPQATSSWILDPGKSFMVPEPRASTMMNVLVGWRAWNAIWCGENLTLLLFVTFNSSVKKCP